MPTDRQQAATTPVATERASTTRVAADGARERAARLAQGADALIDRILSGDSRAFLDANRQTGGE